MLALRRLAGRLPITLVLLALTACSEQITSESTLETADVPIQIVRQIEGLKAPDFSVIRISKDGIATRVDVILSETPPDRSTLERRTMNALYSIQSIIGTEEHLAVWASAGDPPVIQGMAFYSSLTEQYTFKTSGEIR